MSVYFLSSKSELADASYLIKVGTKSVLVNCPGGTQRLVNAYGVGFGDISVIVLTRPIAGNVEGLPGLLMTKMQSDDPMSCRIVAPTQFELLQHLNEFAIDKIYNGEVMTCVDRAIVLDDQLEVVCKNLNGTLNVTVKPHLKVVNFDQEALRRLNLTGQQMKKLREGAELEVNGQVIRTADISVTTECGWIHIVQHQVKIAKPVNKSLIVNGCEEEIAVENCETVRNTMSGYPISDFIAFYEVQTTAKFTQTDQFELRAFTIFPPKKFGFETVQREKKQTYVKLNESVPAALNDQILFLGTGASIPNKYNNVSGQVLKLDGSYYLVDCGEGTLQQLMHNQSGIKFSEMDDLTVLVTHEHADHYLGLPSFLESYHNVFGRYPPVYCQELVQKYLSYCGLKVTCQQTMSFTHNNHKIERIGTQHCEFSCAYLIFNEVKQILFSGDTLPLTRALLKTGLKTTVVHEATFRAENQKEAVERMHSTMEDVIKEFGQGDLQLVLTHFSQRHAKEKILQEDEQQRGILQAFDMMAVGV